MRLSAIILAVGVAVAAPQAKKSAPSKKSAPAATAKKKPAAKKKSSSRYARRRPSTQAQPSPDRYREIQQALQKKGYLSSEPTGVWGPDSANALRQFQQDQNLKPTGKLDSLSLIALGLGPKRDNGLQTKTEPK